MPQLLAGRAVYSGDGGPHYRDDDAGLYSSSGNPYVLALQGADCRWAACC